MKQPVQPLELAKLRMLPLAQRKSLTRVEDILIQPDSKPAPCPPELEEQIRECAARIRAAKEHGTAVILVYGAHLLRNGAALILEQMMAQGWLTHLATNGAGTIHDWEYAWLGKSTESVEENVATGTFGTWEETGLNIHLGLLAGGLRGEGYGRALGRFIVEDGATLPTPEELSQQLRAEPGHPLAAARAEALRMMHEHNLAAGRHTVEHRWRHGSIVGSAFKLEVPLTVHPGIGYDIVACHPMFNGAVIGRAAEWDFKLFAGSVQGLDGGVVLSVGSAIMGPQVFEKSLSCVHNLRVQAGQPLVDGHSIYVVDLQDGGGWDWEKGEPPKTHAAYYLRFCKSYSRMGGTMRYLQCDNAAFIHNLYRHLIDDA